MEVDKYWGVPLNIWLLVGFGVVRLVHMVSKMRRLQREVSRVAESSAPQPEPDSIMHGLTAPPKVNLALERFANAAGRMPIRMRIGMVCVFLSWYLSKPPTDSDGGSTERGILFGLGWVPSEGLPKALWASSKWMLGAGLIKFIRNHLAHGLIQSEQQRQGGGAASVHDFRSHPHAD